MLWVVIDAMIGPTQMALAATGGDDTQADWCKALAVTGGDDIWADQRDGLANASLEKACDTCFSWSCEGPLSHRGPRGLQWRE
jgi:hypothetical protein